MIIIPFSRYILHMYIYISSSFSQTTLHHRSLHQTSELYIISTIILDSIHLFQEKQRWRARVQCLRSLLQTPRSEQVDKTNLNYIVISQEEKGECHKMRTSKRSQYPLSQFQAARDAQGRNSNAKEKAKEPKRERRTQGRNQNWRFAVASFFWFLIFIFYLVFPWAFF